MLEKIFGFLTVPVPAIVVAILMVMAVLVFPLRYLISRVRREQDDALNAIGMEVVELKNNCVVLKDELRSLKQEKTGITTEELDKIKKDVARNVELKLIELKNLVGNTTESDPISQNSLKTEEDGPASIYRELAKLNKNISVAIALLMELRHASGHTSPKTRYNRGLTTPQNSSMRSVKGDESYSAT